MADLLGDVDRVAAASGFSGVVRVDRGEEVVLERAGGLADRRHGIPNAVDTQFALASGLKGMTALVVMCLVEDGVVSLETTARSLLGDDLPLIADDVTVEHLLAHRSGIGDYLDEDAGGEITDYVMPVPVHELVSPEDYLAVLDGCPTKFAAGTGFSYCNGGYVVLALLAERASGVAYHDLVVERVCAPAGMYDTAFLRSDELPPRAALGYLAADGPRTNVLHLPVRGTGDGGIYSTAADIRALWTAFLGGRIVSPASVAEMTRPRSDAPENGKRYGLGFWLHASSGVVILEGYDAGVSFRSLHDPERDLTCTVVSNWTNGAWELASFLERALEL
jgi:CubicO group peptidase (beta-lactamase class C family)